MPQLHRVLVTGGTGFVGRYLVRELKARGYRVSLLVRPESKVPEDCLDCEVFPGNIWQGATLQQAFSYRPDAVIHLVGIIQPYKQDTFERVHVVGTKNLVGYAEGAEVERFIHMSALGARADSPSQYHRTKWAAEEIVRSSRLNYTIFRPSIIFGEESQFIKTLIGLLRIPLVTPVVGLGSNKLQPIYVGDVARFFVDALDNPVSLGKTLELGGPRFMEFDRILDLLMLATQVRRVKIHFPIYLLRPLVFFMERLLPRPPLTNDQLTMLKQDNICDVSEALNLFDFPLVDFEEWVLRNLSQGLISGPADSG
jgi:NADH dehydrogenase